MNPTRSNDPSEQELDSVPDETATERQLLQNITYHEFIEYRLLLWGP